MMRSSPSRISVGCGLCFTTNTMSAMKIRVFGYAKPFTLYIQYYMYTVVLYLVFDLVPDHLPLEMLFWFPPSSLVSQLWLLSFCGYLLWTHHHSKPSVHSIQTVLSIVVVMDHHTTFLDISIFLMHPLYTSSRVNIKSRSIGGSCLGCDRPFNPPNLG